MGPRQGITVVVWQTVVTVKACRVVDALQTFTSNPAKYNYYDDKFHGSC